MVIMVVPFLLLACHGSPPADLGVHDGLLAPCPQTSNCVSSQASDDEHRVAPLPYAGPAADAMTKLRGIIRSLPRTRIVTDTGTYLHVEFTSALFRFVDDAEFLADDRTKVIHVRSASRIGRFDLGANRARIERIRAYWMKLHAAR
jgi:uncharacterized protein (DUF1499 family)